MPDKSAHNRDGARSQLPEGGSRRPKKHGFFAKKELLSEGTGGFRPGEAEPPMGSARRFLFLISVTKRPCRRGLRQLPHGKSSFFTGKKFFSREKLRATSSAGYLMVESMVAIMIVTVGLLGIFALLSRSISLNRVVSDRFVATYLAAEGIEIVKNIIDNNLIAGRLWNEGLLDGDYEVNYDDLSLQTNQNRSLRFDSVNGLYSYSGANPTNFQRTILIANSAGGEEITVNSKAQWLTRGGGRFSVNLEDHFFNWR